MNKNGQQSILNINDIINAIRTKARQLRLKRIHELKLQSDEIYRRLNTHPT